MLKALSVFLTVVVAALLLYWRTLLPGLDLGDTASFQSIVTFPFITGRHAYPIYYGLGKFWLWATGWEPAVGLNALSAVLGAVAAGLFGVAGTRLANSAVAGLWSGLLLAGSYTFWSQSVIAEVYALQMAFIAATVLAWLRWAERPSLARFAGLCLVYAFSFGHHLSMILFAPAIVLACSVRAGSDPGVRATAFSGRALAIAAAAAAAGSLVYSWNLYGTWLQLEPGSTIGEALEVFWNDVTKADWRETLVGTLPRELLRERLAMYAFDLRQQFGAAGAALAPVGAWWLWRGGRRSELLLLAGGWLSTTAFAFWYHVGDTHVFLLPSHGMIALAAGAGVASIHSALSMRPSALGKLLTIVLLAYPLWRIVDTLPAVDRSRDRRAEALCDGFLTGLNGRNAVVLGDSSWQFHNALGHYLLRIRPDIPETLSSEVMQHFPLFADDNLRDRDIVLTTLAADRVRAAFGPLYRIVPDPRARVRDLWSALAIAAGTPYVVAILTPLPGVKVESTRLADAVRRLADIGIPQGRYAVIAGVAGSPPDIARGADRPFRARARVGALDVEVRVEAWLPFDTIRRAGFGHVLVNGRHALTIERGVSVAILRDSSDPLEATYAGGSFDSIPRFLIPRREGPAQPR